MSACVPAALGAPAQTGANDIKAKVHHIEQSQNKINQVRQTMEKVGSVCVQQGAPHSAEPG